jgi:hypothetical protein
MRCSPWRERRLSGRDLCRHLCRISASGKLLRPSSESLAGRAADLELTPFLIGEATPIRRGYPVCGCAADFRKAI